MKYAFAVVLLFALPALAQRYRAPGGVVFTSPSGFGNAVFPGTGRAPVASVPSRPGSVIFPGTGGGPNSNFNVRPGGAAPAPGRSVGTPSNRRNRGVTGVPVYVGAYTSGFYGEPSWNSYYGYGAGYEGPQQQQPVNVTVVNPAQQTPTVIINQNFGPQQGQGDQESQAGMHISQPSSPAPVMSSAGSEAQPEPHYFLVAFKDHSVYSALAYWIEDKTMHYVTPQNTHNQASLDLIDMDFTKKLNNQN